MCVMLVLQLEDVNSLQFKRICPGDRSAYLTDAFLFRCLKGYQRYLYLISKNTRQIECTCAALLNWIIFYSLLPLFVSTVIISDHLRSRGLFPASSDRYTQTNRSHLAHTLATAVGVRSRCTPPRRPSAPSQTPVRRILITEIVLFMKCIRPPHLRTKANVGITMPGKEENEQRLWRQEFGENLHT